MYFFFFLNEYILSIIRLVSQGKDILFSFNQSDDPIVIVLFLNTGGICFLLVLLCPFLKKQQ